MKLKEYIQGKLNKTEKEAQTPDVYYKLNDLVWLDNWVPGNEDKALNIPFLPNNTNTKFKNLLNNEIIEMPISYKGSNPKGNTLARSLGRENMDGLRVATSADVLYGSLLLDKQPSSQVIRELKAFLLLNNAEPNKTIDTIQEFCQGSKISSSDLNGLIKSIQVERNKSIKASIEHNEEKNRETLSRDF